MAFHIQRPHSAPGRIPECKDTLALKIEFLQHALRDRDRLKLFSELFWLYGPERHEPLPYRYRLEDDAPPPPDATITTSPLITAATQPQLTTSHRPISGIIRSDMPPRFRPWFLQDDVIFFRTRSPAYLTNDAASACKKEATQRRNYERLWELLHAWIEAEGSSNADLPSYGKKCAVFALSVVLHVLGKLRTIVGTSSSSSSSSVTSMPSDECVLFPPISGLAATKGLSSMFRLFTSTVVSLWYIYYILGLVLTWGTPAYRLMIRTKFGDMMGVPPDPAAVDYGCRCRDHPSGYHTWKPAGSVTSETKPAGSLYKNPDPAELRLLILAKRIQESIRALRSFWDFHRRTTSAAGGGEDRYRPVYGYRPSNKEQVNIGGGGQEGAAKTHHRSSNERT